MSTLYSLCLCISLLSYSVLRTLPLRGRGRGHVVVDVVVDVSICCSKFCKSSSVNVEVEALVIKCGLHEDKGGEDTWGEDTIGVGNGK